MRGRLTIYLLTDSHFSTKVFRSRSRVMPLNDFYDLLFRESLLHFEFLFRVFLTHRISSCNFPSFRGDPQGNEFSELECKASYYGTLASGGNINAYDYGYDQEIYCHAVGF